MRVKALASGGAEMKGTQRLTKASVKLHLGEGQESVALGTCFSVSQIRRIKEALSCAVLLIGGPGGIAPGVLLDWSH